MKSNPWVRHTHRHLRNNFLAYLGKLPYLWLDHESKFILRPLGASIAISKVAAIASVARFLLAENDPAQNSAPST